MTPFSLILNLLTHYFHKILDQIGSKFVSRTEPGYRIFDEVSLYLSNIILIIECQQGKRRGLAPSQSMTLSSCASGFDVSNTE